MALVQYIYTSVLITELTAQNAFEIVVRYFHAVKQDPLSSNILLHVQRPIQMREFLDYSVWLNLGQDFQFNEHVRELTTRSLHEAWPENLSTKVRIMADAYLDGDMLAA